MDPARTCTRRTLAGSTVCGPHRKTSAARAWDATVRQAAQDADAAIAHGAESDAAHRFRRRVARGEYRDLFDDALARILAQAAARQDVDDEIGAVRYALARLLAEEQDPSRLALGVTRLTRAAVATSRERRESKQDQPDGLTEAMTRILADLDMKIESLPVIQLPKGDRSVCPDATSSGGHLRAAGSLAGTAAVVPSGSRRAHHTACAYAGNRAHGAGLCGDSRRHSVAVTPGELAAGRQRSERHLGSDAS